MKNEKEKFEPVKIGYNESGCSTKLYQLKNSIEKLNECRIRVENLGLSWTIDTLEDLFDGGIKSESIIVQGIRKEVSGISFPVLREKMQQELDSTIMHDYKQLRIDINQLKPDCDTNYLEISGGVVRITDEGKKAIENSSVLWANTPEELEIWQEATELVERLEKLDEKLKAFGVYAICRDDMNRPALISLSLSYPKTDPFMLAECNTNGLWFGKR